MTLATQTAPLTDLEKEAIREELAAAIRQTEIVLPSRGCDDFTFRAVMNSADETIREILRKIPSESRGILVGQAVQQAATPPKRV